jgi:hypothetical protein
LIVNWVPNEECNATFTDLFENGPSGFFSLLPLILPTGIGGAINMKNIASSANLTLSIIGVEEIADDVDFMLDPAIVMSDVNVVYTSYSGVVTMKDSKCQNYLTLHSNFLKSLVPVEDIRETVASVMAYFGDRYVLTGNEHCLNIHSFTLTSLCFIDFAEFLLECMSGCITVTMTGLSFPLPVVITRLLYSGHKQR